MNAENKMIAEAFFRISAQSYSPNFLEDMMEKKIWAFPVFFTLDPTSMGFTLSFEDGISAPNKAIFRQEQSENNLRVLSMGDPPRKV